MPTLLLSRTCQPEADQLVKVAHRAGWNHQWLRRGQPPKHLSDGRLGFYGETDVAARLIQHHPLVLIEPSFDLLAKLPNRYTRRTIEFQTLGEAIQRRERAFVKPADCMHKCFDASVWEAGKYILCSDDLSRTTPVLVSEPVSWSVEYRVIVLERTVITFSPYIREGWRAQNAQNQWPYPEAEAGAMTSFCRELLADPALALPPVFTLDVGFIETRGWAVVEFNPVWCSGFLGCDRRRLLPVLARACRHRDLLSEQDKQWVIARDGERRPAR